jgi:hypothetical protein
MKQALLLFSGGLLAVCPALGQDFTNAGSLITVEPGAALYVGKGGFSNQAGGTTTNAGTLRVDGPLTSAGTLDLSTGALEVRGNFTNVGTLTPGTSSVSFSGLADQLLTPGGAALYQVLVNKPTTGANTLRLASSLTINNLLNLANGMVSTQAPGGTLHTLRLPNGAALSGEAPGRYVLGTLQITRDAVSGGAVDFGHGLVLDPRANHLGSVTVTRTAGLQTAEVSYGQNLSGTAKGIDRIWTVSPAAPPAAGQPVQLTLNWLPDNDNGLLDFAQARVWQQAAVGAPWAATGPAANASSRSLSAPAATLGRFTVSNAANPLPVTLVDFTAQAEGPAAVRLHWATATEANNAGFHAERSLDARSFRAVGAVAGAGSSSSRRDYALLDAQLPAGATLLYYRLRQTDFDGTVTYSPVRTVALAPRAAGLVVYPTRLSSGQGAAYLYTGPAGPGTLHVLDAMGRVVRTTVVDGSPRGEVPLAGLGTGAYLLRYTTAAASFTAQFIVE